MSKILNIDDLLAEVRQTKTERDNASVALDRHNEIGRELYKEYYAANARHRAALDALSAAA